MPIEVPSAATRGENIHESAKSRIVDSSAKPRGLADKDEIQKGQSAAGDAGSNLSDGLIQDRKVTVWNRTDFPIQASINASFSGGGNPEKFTIAPGGYEEWHRSSSPVGHYALHYFNAEGDELGTVRFGIGNNDREFDFTPQSAVGTDGDDLLDGLIEDRKVTVCNRTDFPIQASINASFSGGGNPEKFTIAPGASETWTRSPSPVGHYALHYFNAEGDELGTVRFGIGISDREFDFEFKAQSAAGADRGVAAEGVADSDLFDGLIQDHKVTVVNRTANLIQASLNASFSGGGGNTFKFTLAPGGSETWTRSLSPSGYYALRVYDTAGELLRTINFGIGKSDCEFEIV